MRTVVHIIILSYFYIQSIYHSRSVAFDLNTIEAQTVESNTATIRLSLGY